MKAHDARPRPTAERRGRRRFPDEDAFWRGYRAGLAGRPAMPEGGRTQDLDWLAGWIEGTSERGAMHGIGRGPKTHAPGAPPVSTG